jgi:hypothetical protein
MHEYIAPETEAKMVTVTFAVVDVPTKYVKSPTNVYRLRRNGTATATTPRTKPVVTNMRKKNLHHRPDMGRLRERLSKIDTSTEERLAVADAMVQMTIR